MSPKPAPKKPADQAARDRFIGKLDRNFSVLAPAGVGKTKAIVDRIVAIATGDPERAQDWLPRLVVVTYTKKAADEMLQRARNAIIAQKADLTVLTQFNRAFFGTIHSFCVKLLRTHGHLAGLSPGLDAMEDDDESWMAFTRQLDDLAPALPVKMKQDCLRHMPVDEILALARSLRRGHLLALPPNPGPCPTPRLDALLAVLPSGRSADTIRRSQDACRAWQQAVKAGTPYVPLPSRSTKDKNFVETWEHAWSPLADWLKRAGWLIAAQIAEAYRAYRLQRGQLTFDDQIDLALDLVRDPRASAMLRREGYRIVLDEAQDTDPSQFAILLELARPTDAEGFWFENGGTPPAPGRFCMVGDPQQSIYGSRADLAVYEDIRRKLAENDGAEELRFTVTFRCDETIIDRVNELGPPMLHGRDRQAAFIPLKPRPDAGPGSVVRLRATGAPPDEEKVDRLALHEARELAKWIAERGPAGLGASAWNEVAILCPRRRWFDPLVRALEERKLRTQLHSERSIRGDRPAFAWTAALVRIATAPDDAFEVAGVLREVFGLSDAALARHSGGDGNRLQLDADHTGTDDVSATLAHLAALVKKVRQLALRDAVSELIRGTALRARILTIEDDAEQVDEELDGLIARAAVAEAAGQSLADFSADLLTAFEQALPTQAVEAGAIQLITCHKAKGLQWDVVILPMLFRTIALQNDYPMMVPTGAGRPPRLLLDSGDLDEDLKAEIGARQEQELQRLLYVALTRARHTMVLVDDRDVFRAKKQRIGSFGDRLGLVDEEGQILLNETWEAIGDALKPGKQAAQAVSSPAPLKAAPETGPLDLAAAVESAQAAPRRLLPYALAETVHEEMTQTAERVDEAPSAGAENARQYGIWWHETMEAVDWSRGVAALKEAAGIALENCPMPDRGAREIDLLAKSDLPARLSAKGAIVHRELPFSLARSAGEWLEGVMDLALFDPAVNGWLLLDWKTNVVTPESAGSLRDLYAPQLGAYAEALKRATGLTVTSGVYSTVTGLWIPV